MTGTPTAPLRLMDLPDWALASIARTLTDERDVASLRRTCRELNALYDERLYGMLVAARFPAATPPPPGRSNEHHFRELALASLRTPAAAASIIWLDDLHLRVEQEPYTVGSHSDEVVRVVRVCWLQLTARFEGILPGKPPLGAALAAATVGSISEAVFEAAAAAMALSVAASTAVSVAESLSVAASAAGPAAASVRADAASATAAAAAAAAAATAASAAVASASRSLKELRRFHNYTACWRMRLLPHLWRLDSLTITVTVENTCGSLVERRDVPFAELSHWATEVGRFPLARATEWMSTPAC